MHTTEARTNTYHYKTNIVVSIPPTHILPADVHIVGVFISCILHDWILPTGTSVRSPSFRPTGYVRQLLGQK